MALKHTNPTKPRFDKKDRMDVWAVAPYNFVPLPEKMVEAQPPLNHDRYHPEPVGFTGWIECELETCSPTYIRGMLTEKQFADFGQAGPDQLKDEQKEAMAGFFGLEKDVPLIPGSSLRGMIRQLVEIVGHGRMRYVSPTPTFTYRAVGNLSNDPLKEPYKEIIGNNASKIKAGYLKRKDDKWFIIPALTQKAVKWSNKSNDQYIKVYDEDISDSSVPGFLRIGHSKYVPQIHQISFKYGPRKRKTNWGGKGSPTRPSIVVGPPGANLGFTGILVCAGDMLETTRSEFSASQNKNQDAKRNKHIIVLPPITDENKELVIPEQAIEDYRAGLTDFHNENLDAWGGKGWGCLKDGAPVFYVPEGNVVRYFGHSPNFRIPARLNLPGETRAANPRDFVPAHLRDNPQPDLADAIFGWVEEKDKEKVVGPAKQRAGRVFFSDGRFESATHDLWFKEKPITPHVLSGPKPTTFQHYLVQDGCAGQSGHHPDNKVALAHYGTPPDETQIRGYKLYWHKGKQPDIEAGATELAHPKQLTKIKPLQAGVHFRFKVYFENLRPEELGLLWWALALPGEPGKQYRHKLGMGKPLGMGAVTITPHLFITDRTARYKTLFTGESWQEAAQPADARPYLDALNRYLLQEQGLGARRENLTELERIQMLLTMLEWREGKPEWLAKTRYMEIEHGARKVNEYKERPVLPDPMGVISSPGSSSPSLSRLPPGKPGQGKTQSGGPGEQLSGQHKPKHRQSKTTPTTTAVPPQKPATPKAAQPTAPQVGEQVRGIVDTREANGDVYLRPDNPTYQDWLLRIAQDRQEGINYQIGQQRNCIVLELLSDDDIVECKPAPKKKQAG